MGKYLNEKEQKKELNWETFKTFLKSKWVMICVPILCALLLGVLICVLWVSGLPKFQDVTVELGTQSVSITQFMTRHANMNKVGFVSDISTIDLSKVGTTQLTLRHGNQVQTVTFCVVDTTAPEVTFLEEMTMRQPGIPDAEDLVKSVSDLSDTTIAFAENLEVPADYADLICPVVVTDASGNTTTGECVLHFGRIRSEVVLEYGMPLTKADILLVPERDGDLIDQAQIDDINNALPGEYPITVDMDGVEETCTVTVQDTIGPQLIVQDVSVKPGKSVDLEDFVVSVSDTSGGVRLVLTTPIDTRKEANLHMVIEAQDPYGNITTGECTLRVTKDDDGPKINFAHDYVQAYCGGEAPNYMEGVTVFDEVDGACMVVYDDSDVNLDQIGTYEVVYTATDKSGNTTRKRRDVEVTFDYFNDTISKEAQALLDQHNAKVGSDPEEIRDYVRDNIKYNSNWGGDDPISYGFNKRKGNCYVHAIILKAMLDAKGHETQLIWVEDHTHYWVVVKIGDVWRHIDATPSRGFHNKYSLMDDAQRFETLKGRDWDREQWPACE